MKHLIMAVVLLFGISISAPAQKSSIQATNEISTSVEYSIVERGSDYRIIQKVTQQVDRLGKTSSITNSYTELQTGMHYEKDGQWIESEAKVELAPGGAIAINGPHKVNFAANIKAIGAIDVTLPDKRKMKSHVIGLSYFDTVTGKSALIAEIQDSIGLLAPPNQVIYPDAFTDVKADIRYTYTKRGFEQDIILREQPPSPAEYGLNVESTRLEVLTEFVEAPEPVKSIKNLKHGGTDQKLDFGSMTIGKGVAFLIGEGNVRTNNFQGRSAQVSVGKNWARMEGRDFLIESVDYQTVKPQLETLEKPEAMAGPNNDEKVAKMNKASERRKLPVIQEARDSSGEMQIASLDNGKAGFLIDYVLVSGSTDYTFKGDTTYLINEGVSLFGTTTLEGGTVIKFATDTSLIYSEDGLFNCKTDSYRPAVFTDMNDDSIGETISGSSGVPEYWEGMAILSGNPVLSNVRFSYGVWTLSLWDAESSAVLSDVQYVNCVIPINIEGGSVALRNVLITGSLVPLRGNDAYTVTAEHVTIHGADPSGMTGPGNGTIFFTNSIVVAVTNLGAATIITNNSVIDTNSIPGIFQPVGGAGYYLATNSIYRDVGTTNINETLLANLRKKTTYPPIVISNVVYTNDLVLSLQAPRDDDTPDLGYHYDPLDYLASGVAFTNATVTITNGAAIGMFNDLTNRGFLLQENSRLVSVGSPLFLNRLVCYNAVQEQPMVAAATGVGGLISAMLAEESGEALVEFTMMAGRQIHFESVLLTNVSFVNCQFYGGEISVSGIYSSNIVQWGVTNCLFERVSIVKGSMFQAVSATFRNNLFYGGSVELDITGDSNFSFRDNIFDQTILLDYAAGFDRDFNSYIGGSSWEGWTLTTNDIVLTNFAYANGPLGPWYQASAQLLNKGSQSATNVGLYHFTVATNQIKETNSVVDIGFHYVALNESNQPFDTDSDGWPDYVEDANGNGEYDPNLGEFAWYSVATPSISPSGGSFPISQNATLSCVTPGASIHYTFNGNDPTNSDPAVVSGQSLLVTRDSFIKARAFKGLVASDVQSASFSIALSSRIASGASHTLGLRSDGLVFAAGRNNNGQLGIGSTIDQSNYVAVAGISNVIALEAGDLHSLALLSDGTVKAWGNNGNGRLGDGTTTQRTSPVSVTNLASVNAVAAGASHSLALKSDGTVWAWGLNSNGQLGDGSTTQRTTPVQVSGLSGIIAISAGDTHSLALKSNGTVWAWGNNSNGRLGSLTSGIHSNAVQVVTNLDSVIAIAGGGSHSMALLSDGTVWAWGLNSNGQLGNNSVTASTNAVQVTNLNSVMLIAAGSVHSMAVLSDGTVRAWGDNAKGQLGDGTVADRRTNVVVLGISNIVALAGGDFHSVALRSDGTIWAWGDHQYGQLASYEFDFRAVPGLAVGVTNIHGVAAGAYHNFAFQSNGLAFGWGRNTSYELGNANNLNQPYSTQIAGISNVVQMEAGDTHGLALKSDGTVWAWGNNANGRLGDGTTTDRSTPILTTNLNSVIAVAAGASHSLALKSDGTVWAWGLNSDGQLGDGTVTQRTVPVQVSVLTDITAIAAGDTHSLAVKSDGTVWAWGNNGSGRLGSLTPGDHLTPVQVVTNIVSAVAVAGGASHSLALLSDGTVRAWGGNGSGQLGNNTISTSTNAVQVTNLASVMIIGSGATHSLAVLSNGTVRAWGAGANGRLGNDLLTNQRTNVAVIGISNIVGIAGGDLHSIAVQSDGSVWVWGASTFGQLGDGNIGYNSIPLLSGGGLNLLLTPDDFPPLVSLITPQESAVYAEPATIPIHASASGGSSSVKSVVILRGLVPISQFSAEPFHYSWPLVAAGQYSLTAVARDLNGLATTSAPVNITVTNLCTNP